MVDQEIMTMVWLAALGAVAAIMVARLARVIKLLQQEQLVMALLVAHRIMTPVQAVVAPLKREAAQPVTLTVVMAGLVNYFQLGSRMERTQAIMHLLEVMAGILLVVGLEPLMEMALQKMVV